MKEDNMIYEVTELKKHLANVITTNDKYKELITNTKDTIQYSISDNMILYTINDTKYRLCIMSLDIMKDDLLSDITTYYEAEQRKMCNVKLLSIASFLQTEYNVTDIDLTRERLIIQVTHNTDSLSVLLFNSFTDDITVDYLLNNKYKITINERR